MSYWGIKTLRFHYTFKCRHTDILLPYIVIIIPYYGTCRSYYNYHISTLSYPPCRIRSDRQTTSLTLTTGVCEAGTKMRGASNMNIHYDVTGLLTAAWRSHSGQIV